MTIPEIAGEIKKNICKKLMFSFQIPRAQATAAIKLPGKYNSSLT
jgi:hypothetical protein